MLSTLICLVILGSLAAGFWYWYDNNAAGVRCTMVISVDNPINYCDLEEHFDPEKEFDLGELLHPIDTDDAAGCADVSFDYKLPKITL